MALWGGQRSGLVSGLAFIALAVVSIATSLPGSNGREKHSAIEQPRGLNRRLTNEYCHADTLRKMESSMERFLAQWGIHGATLAVMRNDSLVYAHGFGYADENVPMEPNHLMRVASVSKLITAAGIMKLVEEGKLALTDTVFGPEDILGEYSSLIKDKNWFRITIEHLLMHEAGFIVGGAGDPLFSTRTLMRRYDLSEPPSADHIIRSQLSRRLGYKPGTSSRYSNFGYLLLSVIIEKAGGKDYETWIKDNILTPAGCHDMHIARNYYEERYPGECRYHAHAGEEPVLCFEGDSVMVERCYGANDITALQGAGAWVCSVPELMLLIASIDGRPEVPDVLSRESVERMTAPTDDVTFGLGWNDCSPEGTWTRSGTLSSTSALIKYFPDGECWILVTNTGTYRGPHFTKYISTQFRRMRELYSPILPTRDLFQE